MPAGVHLAVVDPGVGHRARRRAWRCAPRSEGRMLVGPDNGLLMLAAERLGGVVEAVDIGAVARAPASRSRRRSTAATSSRRSPPPSPPASRWPTSASRCRREALRRLSLPARARARRRARPRTSLRADHFGNLMLDASRPSSSRRRACSWASRCRCEVGGRLYGAALRLARSPTSRRASCCSTRTRCGRLALAVNRGSAAEHLGVRRDEELLVRPA